MVPVITIDGPSGSGKGTVSRLIARKLGWHFLDSGSIYRVLAYYVTTSNIDLRDFTRIILAAKNLAVVFKEDSATKRSSIWLNNSDITNLIRTEEVGAIASQLAVNPEIREALLSRQRNFAVAPGLVADGRDMGTIVFPDAMLKIYLDASVEERAIRRYKELQQNGHQVNLQEINDEIRARDFRDKNRAIAPLIAAEDAVSIDSTKVSPEEICDMIMHEYKEATNSIS